MTKRSSDASDQELYDFTSSIYPARSAWVQTVREALDDVSISSSLGVVILLVYRNGPRVSQGILAARAGVTPATLVRTIDQGEQAGLLTRSQVVEDRRVREIELSAQGKKYAARIEKRLTALRRNILGSLPSEEIRVATKVLKLLASVGER
ncbi:MULTISPECIES: MarR family winged helix-turn-helix transcriptional regulator [Alcaligenaceae]|uniref:MarR family winged helix-turn-helix transcriptional regulator n=1 Tax=Bordetella genomosp. 10 TaxID=1416804 RepID=UPI0015C5A7F9|nr:MarR family winged helix-turn-helix transcriptional regulator [Bordetella genomosp. 10]